MVNALYANGMIGGKDLQAAIESVNVSYDDARREVLSNAPSDEDLPPLVKAAMKRG